MGTASSPAVLYGGALIRAGDEGGDAVLPLLGMARELVPAAFGPSPAPPKLPILAPPALSPPIPAALGPNPAPTPPMPPPALIFVGRL